MTDARKEFLWNVFVTAMEGGVNYWAEVGDYHWSTGDGDTEDHEKFGALLTEWDDDGQLIDEHKVSLPTIQRGIARIVHGDELVSEDRRETIITASFLNDATDIDADLADCIVQAGLFGELVYG
jgi:hypothetical protein